jgi:hypothetical protein
MACDAILAPFRKQGGTMDVLALKDPEQPTTGRRITFHWRKGEGLEVFTTLPILNIGKVSRPGFGVVGETSAENSGNFLLSGKVPVHINTVGRGSFVGIWTHYGLDGPWIESRWGRGEIFAPVQGGPTAHSASYTMGTGSFLGAWR